MEATSLEVVGGTSAALEGTKISAGLAGQTMLRAKISFCSKSKSKARTESRKAGRSGKRGLHLRRLVFG